MPKTEEKTVSDDPDILEELYDSEMGSDGLLACATKFKESELIARQGAKNFENSKIPLIALDADMMIVYYSPRLEELLRDYYSICHRPFFNIFGGSLDAYQMRSLVLSLRSEAKGRSWTGILCHKTAKTKTLWTNTTFIPFFSGTGDHTGFLVYFEDITETRYNQLHATFTSILEAAKLKDNDTGKHVERVGFYSKKMAEYLYGKPQYPQVDPDFIDNISFLAAMHDVGKIGTPDYILLKPGKLSEQEWSIMREHTINGTFILSSYPVPMAKEIALSHHEWWNGGGYPFKLEGDMIPLAARIVTIADVYDALRMKRSYKDEFTHDEAVQKIVSGSGTQFDPDLIEIFQKISGDFNEIWNILKDVAQPKADDERDRSQEFDAT